MISLADKVVAPYRFDMAYARCYAVPEVAMDVRHVFMLHGVLTAWRFEEALEIGSFNGASSTAFVEAVNADKLGRATFCEVSPTHSLAAVIDNCRHPDRVRLTPQPSWQVLNSNEPFDFILVDAAHDLESVSLELKYLMKRRPLCVMAHDTNATDAGYSKCEGAKLLAETFTADNDYHVLHDRVCRPGERTDRGLFFATTDSRLYTIAHNVFARFQA